MKIPESPEGERGVLSCMIQDPSYCIPEVQNKLSPLHFYDLKNREIYDLLIKLYDEAVPIGVGTVVIELKKAGKLDAIGGPVYLELIDSTSPSPANMSYYIKDVENKLCRRMILDASKKLEKLSEDAVSPTENLVDLATSEASSVADSVAKQETHIKDDVLDAIDWIESIQGKGNTVGLKTGYSWLDAVSGGFKEGEVTILAARPGVGKTALAMNVTEHLGVNTNTPVAFFSFEMTKRALITRMMCSLARVNADSLTGLNETDLVRLTSASGKISKAPIHLVESTGYNIIRIRSKARQLYHKEGIKLIVVDYLQLVSAIGGKNKNREREVAEISSGLKSLALDLNIPIIALSQLNRGIDSERERKPRLSDIRESGAIEQDADVVSFLYRTCDDEELANPCYPVNLMLAKNRSGSLGEVKFTFLKQLTRFEQLST